MDESNLLNHWKTCLNSTEQDGNYNVSDVNLQELDLVFRHLSTQFAPRLQKEYQECAARSKRLFVFLFDNTDLSNKTSLATFLRTLISFGFLRLAQITHHIHGTMSEKDPNSYYTPSIEKMRWYELRPLLPEAGTIGWKAIMNIGLIREEIELSQLCLQLIEQKLQFLSILLTLPHYSPEYCMIRSNGKKVAEKLLELINDSAFTEDAIVHPDARIVSLLNQFLDEEQQASLSNSLVQYLFKGQLSGQSITERESEIIEVVRSFMMDKAKSQSNIFSKLFEHLRCNIIRRKRRHSVENSLSDEEPTLEKFLLLVEQSPDITKLLSDIGDFQVSSKRFQSKYLEYWLDLVSKIIDGSTVATSNSVKIIGACSIILKSAGPSLDQNLVDSLYSLMIRSIERSTQFGADQLFNRCNPDFMMEFTRVSSNLGQGDINTDSLFRFYRSIMRRYIRACIARNAKQEAVKFHFFAKFICEENLERDISHQLQCICVQELASALGEPKVKIGNVTCEELKCSSQTCCKKLLKYVKKYACPKHHDSQDAINNEESITDQSDQKQESSSKSRKKEAAIETLLSILKLAISREDKELIDSYSYPLVRIFQLTKLRIAELTGSTQQGRSIQLTPLDRNLSQFVSLYFAHRDIIQGYLEGDFMADISSTILEELNTDVDSTDLKQHKTIYNLLKEDLNNLNERASKSDQFYHTLINRQFNSLEPNIKNGHGIEEVCCKDMREQISIIGDICDRIIQNCDQKTYRKMLSDVVKHFECCDRLDHPKFIYLAVILETLIPRHEDPAKKIEVFDENLSNLGCCLIEIIKSVQYGPSIYTFHKSGGHNTNISIQSCTYIICIRIYTTLFRRYAPKLSQQLIGDVLQICISANLAHYAKFSANLHRLFIQLCSAISNLLKSISKKQDLLETSLPIFLLVLEQIIQCVIIASDRRRHNSNQLSPSRKSNNIRDQNNNITDERMDYESHLEELAIDIGRILNNVSGLRVKMINFAPHLISSYVQNIQRSNCPEFIQIHLSEGMFRIFNLIDAHQRERHDGLVEAGIQRKTVAGKASGSLFEMIHARLDQASREVFQDLHGDYSKFHKYQAKC